MAALGPPSLVNLFCQPRIKSRVPAAKRYLLVTARLMYPCTHIRSGCLWTATRWGHKTGPVNIPSWMLASSQSLHPSSRKSYTANGCWREEVTPLSDVADGTLASLDERLPAMLTQTTLIKCGGHATKYVWEQEGHW